MKKIMSAILLVILLAPIAEAKQKISQEGDKIKITIDPNYVLFFDGRCYQEPISLKKTPEGNYLMEWATNEKGCDEMRKAGYPEVKPV